MADPAAGEAPKGTRVTFLDQTGAKSVDAVIADTVTVKRILPNVITKMNLPVTGPDGQPMSYSLDHKEGGKRLREEQTLPEAAVRPGDHLIIYPEIVAGCGVITRSVSEDEWRMATSSSLTLRVTMKSTNPKFWF